MNNFHPLNLLNNDYKLFAKILAVHMEAVVSSLIHLDQVGFIKGGLVSDNMRRLFHVMAKAGSLQHPATALSLDAEKAFDRIEWRYLFYVLSKFGFGPVVIRWVMALYNDPIASIKTNGIVSEPLRSLQIYTAGLPCLTIPLHPRPRTSGICYACGKENYWYPCWRV